MRSVVFGHLGDSNIHFIVSVGSDEPDIRRQVEEAVYSAVSQRQGSISAEHGIGVEKRAYLSYSRSESEIKLMGTLKRALDPKNILNPGKVIPVI
jgi:FAD/FMN-containing dehydrogenase